MSKAEARRLRRLREAVPLFAALGDGTRLELLTRLAGGEAQSITALSAGTELTRQAVTKHLGVLAQAGLVRGERRGREHLWVLEPVRLAEAQACLDMIAAQWDDALARLKAFVER